MPRGTLTEARMKKFRFKFSTLEKARKAAQDQAMRVLAESQRAYQAATEHKLMLQTRLQGALIRRESLGAEATSVTAFLLENDFIVGTKHRIVQAEQGIFRARKGVEKSLRNYLVARRQTRAIEMLREKAFLEFKREVAKREQRDLDDLTLMRDRLKREVDAENNSHEPQAVGGVA